MLAYIADLHYEPNGLNQKKNIIFNNAMIVKTIHSYQGIQKFLKKKESARISKVALLVENTSQLLNGTHNLQTLSMWRLNNHSNEKKNIYQRDLNVYYHFQITVSTNSTYKF